MSTKFGVILAARGGVRSSPPSRPPRPPRLNRPRLQQRGELRDGTGAGGWWGWGTGTDEGRGGGGSPSPLPTRVVRDAFALHLCRPKMLSGSGCSEPPRRLRAPNPSACCVGTAGPRGDAGLRPPRRVTPLPTPQSPPRGRLGGRGGGGGRWRHPRIPACLLAVGGTGPGRDQVALCIKPLGRLL